MRKKVRLFMLMMAIFVMVQGVLCYAATHETKVSITTVGYAGTLSGSYGTMTYNYKNNSAMTTINNKTTTKRYVVANVAEYKNGSPTGVMKTATGIITSSDSPVSTKVIPRNSEKEYSYWCNASIYNSSTSGSGLAESFACEGKPN